MNPGWQSRLVLGALRALPLNALSRATGRFARLQLPPPLQRALIRFFARAVGVDWSEVRDPIDSFPSLQSFFTRALRPGVRPSDPGEHGFLSPCDGRWGASGRVEQGMLLQVKGQDYALADLLGSAEDAAAVEGGPYATLYLAPRDYHRFHVPLDARVVRARYLPGSLWPVNRLGVEGVPGLFAVNERICMELKPEEGSGARLWIVAVGATMVGGMRVVFDRELGTNTARLPAQERRYPEPQFLQSGSELGRFEFGSTLVVVAGPGWLALDAREPGTPLRLGTRIGSVLPLGEASTAPHGGTP